MNVQSEPQDQPQAPHCPGSLVSSGYFAERNSFISAPLTQTPKPQGSLGFGGLVRKGKHRPAPRSCQVVHYAAIHAEF